jgi:hypothetical protein
MIPELNEQGLLPPGIHICTLEEFESSYVYNVRRREIFQGLLLLIKDLKTISSPAIYLDGSYVTAKALPNDIDVCWDEGSGTRYAYELKNMPVLFNRNEAKKRYKADVFPAKIVENDSKKMFVDFFQEDKDTGIKKGILKIELF